MSDELPELDDQRPDLLEERLVAYLDGELDDADVREVEQMLASDAGARAALTALERPWVLLDQLGKSPVDRMFARTTLEMVAVAAAEDVAKQQAEIPRWRRRRRILGITAILTAAAAGFLAVALAWPDPNRELIEDLPVLENFDELQRVFGKDENTDVLLLLQKNKLFEEES